MSQWLEWEEVGEGMQMERTAAEACARLAKSVMGRREPPSAQKYDRARFGQELAHMAAVCAEFVVWCREIHGEGLTLETARLLEGRVKFLREMLG